MRLVYWLARRIFTEERSSTIFSIAICVVVLVVTLNISLLRYVPTLVKYLGTQAVSNIALSVGTLVGFLASIPVVTTFSGMLYRDKLTRFIEVLLAAPYSYREVLTAIIVTGIMLSLGFTVLLYSIYCILVILRFPSIMTILVNPYALILALIITILTVELTILLNLLLAGPGRKLRVSGLASLMPSLLLYILITMVIRPMSIKTPTTQILEIVTMLCAMLSMVMILTILRFIRAEHLLA